MKKKLLVFLIALLTIGQVFAKENAYIYLLRPFDFGAAMGAVYGGKKYYQMQHWIDIDGHKLGVVPSTQYFKIEVQPGSHTITGYVNNAPYEDAKLKQPNYSITVNTLAGENYYLRIDEKKFAIERINEKKYEKEQNGRNPIQYAGFLAFKDEKFYTQDGKLIDEKTGKIIEDTQTQLAQGQQSTSQQPSADQLAEAIMKKMESSKELAESEKKSTNKKETPKSDVDINIPVSSKKSKSAKNTFVLIIANEEYKYADKVNFALHDGEVFKEYCVKTLSIPENNILAYQNASVGDIYDAVDIFSKLLNVSEGSRAIIYYCGHGIPDEKTGDAYILPVDGKPTTESTRYSLQTLYSTLGTTKAKDATYFLDACFTGASKEGGMLFAARGVAREPSKNKIPANAFIFSATKGDETAMSYTEKGHGLFTYFLLKKLQETEGEVSYSELGKYVKENVSKISLSINKKTQTPSGAVGSALKLDDLWKNMTLK